MGSGSAPGTLLHVRRRACDGPWARLRRRRTGGGGGPGAGGAFASLTAPGHLVARVRPLSAPGDCTHDPRCRPAPPPTGVAAARCAPAWRRRRSVTSRRGEPASRAGRPSPGVAPAPRPTAAWRSAGRPTTPSCACPGRRRASTCAWGVIHTPPGRPARAAHPPARLAPGSHPACVAPVTCRDAIAAPQRPSWPLFCPPGRCLPSDTHNAIPSPVTRSTSPGRSTSAPCRPPPWSAAPRRARR